MCESIKPTSVEYGDGYYNENILNAIKKFIKEEEYRYHLIERMGKLFNKDCWFTSEDVDMTDLDILSYAIYDNIAYGRMKYRSNKYPQIHINIASELPDKCDFDLILEDKFPVFNREDIHKAYELMFDPTEIILGSLINESSKIYYLFNDSAKRAMALFIHSEQTNTEILNLIEYIKKCKSPKFTEEIKLKFIYNLLKYSDFPVPFQYVVKQHKDGYDQMYSPYEKNVFISNTLYSMMYNQPSEMNYQSRNILSSLVAYLYSLISIKKVKSIREILDKKRIEETNDEIIFTVLENFSDKTVFDVDALSEKFKFLCNASLGNFELKNYLKKKSGVVIIYNCEIENIMLDIHNPSLNLIFVNCHFVNTSILFMTVKNLFLEGCTGKLTIDMSCTELNLEVKSKYLDLSVVRSKLKKFKCEDVKKLYISYTTAITDFSIIGTNNADIILKNNDFNKSVTVSGNQYLNLTHNNSIRTISETKEEFEIYLQNNNYKITYSTS